MSRSTVAKKPLRRTFSQRYLIWLEGILLGVLATVATPMAVLLGGLLLPGLVALLFERTAGKPISRAMLLLCAAAAVAPAANLWEVGLSMSAATQLLGDPLILATAWGAGMFGWAIAEVTPVVSSLVLEARAITRTAALRKMRAELEDEWGLEPREGQDASAVPPMEDE